jgi:hypothetical protein
MEERYLPDEPQGWRELRAIMQQERDPERLAVLVSEINSLLAEHEKQTSVSGWIAWPKGRKPLSYNTQLEPCPRNVVTLTQ